MRQWILMAISLFSAAASFAQSPYPSEGMLSKDIGFGNYLLQSGQYELAALEFERINFNFPENDTVRSLLMKSYRLGRQPIAGLKHCLNWYPWINDSSFSTSKPIELVVFSELCKLLIDLDSNQLLSRVAIHPQTRTLRALEYRNNMILGSYLLTQNWNKAESTLFNCSTCHTDLRAIYENRDFEKGYKNPALAMTLSAIVPGSGKIYAGKWKDGLFSLLFVASNGYASYRGFAQNGIRSPYGWVFGSLGMGFYLGNIHGSGQAAKKHNENRINRINVLTRNVLRNLE